MKPHCCRFAFAIQMLGCVWLPAQAAGQSVAESLERLVYMGSPAPGDVVFENQPANALVFFQSALDKIPGVNERLVGLVRGDFDHSGNSQRLRLSFFALASRNDLTAEQLAALREIEASSGAAGVDAGMKRQFVAGLLKVLAKYPASEHEDLALKYAASDDGLLAMNGVDALAGIGTLRAVPVVRGIVKQRRMQAGGRYDFVCDAMEADFQALLRRLKLKPEVIQIPRPHEPQSVSALREVGPKEEPDAGPAPAAMWTWAALLTAAAGLIALVLVWRKKQYRAAAL